MSHPNPYLFQLSRMLFKLEVGWMFQQVCAFLSLQDAWDFKDVIIYLVEMFMLLMYKRNLLYNIHSNVIFMLYILMYPVLMLTHVPDFLDTSGMGVT
jgi:hypothetical protein